ncbi:MAG: chemotaxis protein CheX [Bryobacterales bacterium]|nr:chemotaxis protein CheX [Bryobacterales bacterium]
MAVQEAELEEIDRQQLLRMVVTAITSVFETMLNMEVSIGESYCVREAPTPDIGVLSLIGFAGKWNGTGSLACSPSGACKVADALFMSEHASVDDEVLDGVAEMTNMILGNVKTELESVFGSMLLSIPTVIYGRNFTTRSLGKKEWLVVPFTATDAHFEVCVCLVPNVEGESLFGNRCSLHV